MAGSIGTRRILKLFEKYNIRASWFIPGHSLEYASLPLSPFPLFPLLPPFLSRGGRILIREIARTFPEECAMVRDAGHEIGLHGYSHENPIDMTLEQQRDILDYTYRMLTKFNNGIPPRGSVAPWWEVSKEATELFMEYGIEYDHSMNHHDCQAYYLRTGDEWTKIDYTQKAETWMKPLVKGKETGMVEIPANWYLVRTSLYDWYPVVRLC